MVVVYKLFYSIEVILLSNMKWAFYHPLCLDIFAKLNRFLISNEKLKNLENDV
jgi:hypothetical protein